MGWRVPMHIAVMGASMCLLFVATSRLFASEVPTPDFLAAALKSQESACGQSLEVNYTYGDIGNESLALRIRYVRTPEILSLSLKQEATGYSVKAWYDRKAHVLRELQQTTKGPSTGLVNDKLDGLLLVTLAMDPLRIGVNGGKLSEVIAQGGVSDRTEDISSIPCWRVTVGSAKAWLDPAIGFCPRKIEVPVGDKTKTYDLREYREVKAGVWFPMRIDATLPQDQTEHHYRYTALDVAIDKTFLPEDLQVLFPSGTEVRDEARGMVYTAP